MAEEPDNTPIQSKYAEQWGTDLAANREEQAKLQRRLQQLRVDEAWLVKQLQETQSTPSAEQADTPVETAVSQAVPQPRQEAVEATATPSGAKEAARAKTAAKGARAPKQKAATTKTRANKAATKVAGAAKSAEPPLHELVLDILRAHPGHPHLAREVHTELVGKYGRSTSIQSVRNNLEKLVTHGTVEKENKQNSAMYTALVASTAKPAADEVSEKVPADA
ncbi:hypothetical protein ACNPQN_32740 [Streptomyces sp. NPDC056297]|uniref:hypothetical protein n=1 Tax=unclassified Streptomyces TaxID=2593676 RepID=UPI0035E3A974